MTNEEKREYLNLKIAYQSTPFIVELSKRNEYINKTPKVLYKYRDFDEYSFDMINNNYVYLTPSGMLDDPFDCLTDIDLSKIIEGDNKTLTKEMMEYIVDIVFSHPHSNKVDKEYFINLIDECTVDGKIDNKSLEAKLDDYPELSLEQKNLFYGVMVNFQNTISTMTEDESLKNLFKVLMQSKEKIGVCSFTTKRDNKPMWSLYSNKYKGYCVEYETPMTKDVIPNLCPVIYTNDSETNIVKIMVKFGLETIIRFISSGQIKTNMGCFTELLCTKDTDWEYQDEWRLIGDAKTKVVPFKIKNIYLGYDVSKENEESMLSYAKVKGFGVYKMDKPKGNNKIEYIKLELK